MRELRDAGIYSKELGAPEIRRDAGGTTIVGYAAVFNQPAKIFGFSEVIRPGAFKHSIEAKSDVRALLNHDPDNIIGRTKSGTLRLSEDEKGLRYEIDAPDTQLARDLVTNLRRGDLDQSSFAFSVLEEEWSGTKDQMTREIQSVELFDVSVVTYPAYENTEAGVRQFLPEVESVDAARTWYEARSKQAKPGAGTAGPFNEEKRQRLAELQRDVIGETPQKA